MGRNRPAPVTEPSKKIKRNKKTKTSIEFDPKKRVEFLMGFRKRKDERRKKAAEQRDQEIRKEVLAAK